MIGLLQRVSTAHVDVDGQCIGKIGKGILAMIGVERNDGAREADRLLQRISNYRMFPDQDGKMDLSLQKLGGGLLLVPQFTLAADTRKGNRASFSVAAPPDQGKYWFEYIVGRAKESYHTVAVGEFGADMQVSLVNDGPVTFWLQVRPGS